MVCLECRLSIMECLRMEEKNCLPLPSNIPGGGIGLFAAIELEQSEWITDYGGEILDKMKVAEATLRGIPTTHIMTLDRRFMINGFQNYQSAEPGVRCRGLAQDINTFTHSITECYVVFDKSKPLSCQARAARKIVAGEEMIGDYLMYDSDSIKKGPLARPHVTLKKAKPSNFDREYRASCLAAPRSRRPSLRRREAASE